MKSTDMHRIQRRIYQENIEQNLESEFTKVSVILMYSLKCSMLL